ncbi:MAG: ECF transporter S component [Oscillospiraceae bacterium]|nr:ECF transporter S component [Oscillospiraceae bacterium]
MRSEKVRKLVTLAILSAMAYIVMVFIRIPVVLFLKYEPKDVIIAIGGFLFGPLSALAMSVVVALVEMVTVSETGIYGAIMNALSSCTFACTAAFVYKKWHKLPGAATGLVCGIVITVPVMLLWNYLIVPIYTSYITREAVIPMLASVFLPFNLLKYGLSAAITMLLYKPVRAALSKSQLLPAAPAPAAAKAKVNIGVILVSALVIITCVLLILSWQGII